MDYVVFIEDGKRCTVKPELEVFEKLHRGKKVKLPNGLVLNKNNNVRLVLMLKSTNEQLPCETYKVYEKLEELPQTLSFSEKKIKSGVLNIAIGSKILVRLTERRDENMKLSQLKKKLLLVLYQGYKAGTKFAFYEVSDLADVIWGDKAFYRSERTEQPLVKNPISVSLRRSLERLKKDRLVIEDEVRSAGKKDIKYCLTSKGASKARKLESEIMEWVSLLKRGSAAV